MPPESEQPQNPPPPKGYFRRAAERLFDHWFEWVGIKSAGDDMKDHALTVEKKGRILSSAAIIVVLSIIGGCWVRGCHDEDEIFTSNSLASSNAVVAKIFESQAESAAQKDTADKIDTADMKREKDAEIAKLTEERDAALARNTQLENFPKDTYMAVSNADAIIKADSTTPSYQLKINGLELTNYIIGNFYVVSLTNSRSIHLRIAALKEGEKSIEKLTIDFDFPIDPTNLIIDTSPGHWQFAEGIFYESGKKCSRIEIISQHTLTSDAGFDATSIDVSTNFQGSFFPARISVYAPGTVGIQQTTVNFLF